MSELTTLLRSAAIDDVAAPDLGAIATRARRRRVARRTRQGSAATAVVAALVLSIGGRHTPTPAPIVEQPAPTEQAPSPAADDEAELVVGADDLGAPPVAVSGQTEAPGVKAPPSPATEPAPPSTDDRGPQTSGPADPPTPDHRAGRAGCRTEWRECTFVADSVGGYQTDGGGDWAITVVRDGISTIYTAADGWCRSGVIQPGDQVSVNPSVGSQSPPLYGGPFVRGFTYLAAGHGYGCAS